MTRTFSIADRTIGRNRPCFIIAEIGVNHNGDPKLAAKLVDAARTAGADAVKFQTFRADRLVVRATPTAEYQKANTNQTDQHEMLRALELDEAAHIQILNQCRHKGIIFLSSPFDVESIDMLDRLDVPAFKAPSPDCISQSYLTHMGAKRRPVILSTGMCDLEEVAFGVETLRKAGSEDIVLLHCTSCYPASSDELNLRVIPALANITGLPVGYSDHSDGIAVSIAAVALGACVIEKHMTLDRNLPGPDHKASLEPAEFAAMVAGIRSVEQALGSPVKAPQPCEASARQLGFEADYLIDLDATSPLRFPEDIKACADILTETGCSCVLTDYPAHRSPYFNLLERAKDGSISLSKQLPDPVLRRQDSPECFDMNGSVYGWKREALKVDPGIFYPDTRLYVIPRDRSIDVDEELDFDIIRMIMERRARN